jgi:hypothetical protein
MLVFGTGVATVVIGSPSGRWAKLRRVAGTGGQVGVQGKQELAVADDLRPARAHLVIGESRQ